MKAFPMLLIVLLEAIFKEASATYYLQYRNVGDITKMAINEAGDRLIIFDTSNHLHLIHVSPSQLSRDPYIYTFASADFLMTRELLISK